MADFSQSVAAIQRNDPDRHQLQFLCDLVMLNSNDRVKGNGMRFVSIAALVLLTACASNKDLARSSPDFTVLSWNITGDAFVSHPSEFEALLRHAAADIVLLDEVNPQKATSAQLSAALPSRKSGDGQELLDDGWHVSFGTSGGRQRGVIASRAPLEVLDEFTGLMPYPDESRSLIAERMSPEDRERFGPGMEDGIAANGAIVRIGGQRLLVVVADLECCGDDPAGWAELKRRVEAKEIRRAIRQVLSRTRVDAIVLAGDFNLVSTPIPLVLMSGPYAAPHSGLVAAELNHNDGTSTWTWDGRGTPFPSRALDYQLYGPNALGMARGTILDTEEMTPEELTALGLKSDTLKQLSRHRPLVVEYVWH